MGQYLNIAKSIISQKPDEKKAVCPATVTKPQVGRQRVPLSGEDACKVAGNVVQLYRMRESCQAAGHCLQHTVERDCALYAVHLGWCRERI